MTNFKNSDFFAKKHGDKHITLIDHSTMVYNVTLGIIRLLNIKDKIIIDESLRAALLHDIGKIHCVFQNYIKDGTVTKENMLYHHEIGYAFMSVIYNTTSYNAAFNAAFWHHPLPMNESRKKNEIDMAYIFKHISERNRNNMTDYLIHIENAYPELFPHKHNINNLIKPRLDYNMPKFYIKSEIDDLRDSNVNTIVRSILISADRICSSEKYDLDKILNNDIKYIDSILDISTKKYVIDKHPVYSNEVGGRFYNQKNILSSINNHTCCINGPTGLGKTLVGLLYILMLGLKGMWVCPRNIIAQNSYYSMLHELKLLGLDGVVTIELVLTGKRVATNKVNDEGGIFNCDIIVTNIDNFQSPFHKNRDMIRSHAFLGYTIVFDEFHEFVQDKPLFAQFIELMNIRNNIIGSHTLLLSATPSILEIYWDSTKNKTQFLPERNKHYLPIHNIPFKITLSKEKDISFEIPSNGENTWCVFNAINTAQEHKKLHQNNVLIHSDFTPDDRNEIEKHIFKMYGKDNLGDSAPIKKEPISATPLLSTSSDLSCKYLYISLSSIEDLYQAIGRCDRFGEYLYPELHLMDFYNNQSELAYVKTCKDIDLKKLLVEFFKENILNNKIEYITLQQLYDLLNMFYVKYRNEIIKSNDAKLKFSRKLLEDSIFPTRWISDGSEPNEEEFVKTSNNIRENKQSFFCTAKIYGTDNEFLSEPFSETIMIDLATDLKEDENTPSRIKKAMKFLNDVGVFIYDKWLRNHRDYKNKLYEQSKFNPNTPYIRFDKQYSKKYGLAKNKIYE